MTTVELTRFRVEPERRGELLAARARMVNDFVADRAGFLDARLVELEDDEWLDVVRWRSPEDYAASRAKGANLPGIAAFFGAISELVRSEEGLEVEVAGAAEVPSREMTRAHALLKELNRPGATLEQARVEYLAWSDRFPVPPGSLVERLPRDEGFVVVGADVEPVRTVLHFHGGGYNVGSARTHREMAARISAAARARVHLLDYPLAPEHPYPAALESAVAAYRHLLEDGVDHKDLMLSGDSAGGNLALVAMLSIRAAGLPLPAAAVLMSPWTDLTISGETMTTLASRDPMVSAAQLTEMAQKYARGHDLRDPLVSPLFADLAGLPPLLVQVGSEEVLLDDSLRLVEAARAAGVQATLSVTQGAPHIWQHFASFLPEAAQAITEYGAFARAHVAVTA